jgi:signal transduction histidine kinase
MFHVEHSVPAGLSAAIDPVALEQILVNLILNARSAMPNGGTISISGWMSAAGVEVRVSDTGCGIPEDRLEAVFATFVSYADVERGSRTGLGLPICRRLVTEAGGTIGLESVVGKGTTVKLVLPATAPSVGGACRASA